MAERLSTQKVEALMKRCQIGVGGKDALDRAHDILAECYGTLGALVQQRDELLTALERLVAIDDRMQREVTVPYMEIKPAYDQARAIIARARGEA